MHVSEENLPMCQLSDFPNVVVERICKYLSLADKKNMRLISIASNWRNLLIDERVLVVRPTATATVTNASIQFFLNTCCRIHQIEEVVFEEVTRSLASCQIEHLPLRSVTFGPDNSFDLMEMVLEKSTGSLESLTLSYAAFNSMNLAPAVITHFLVGIDWRSLTKLDLFVEISFGKHLQCSTRLLGSVFLPNLKSFGIHLNLSSTTPIRDDTIQDLYTNVYTFIDNHCASLRGLHFFKSLDGRQFRRQEIPPNLKESLVKFRILESSLEAYGTCEPYEEFVDILFLVGSSASMKKIKLIVPRLKETAIFLPIFTKHGETLQEIEINVQNLPESVYLSFLKPCINLESFSLTCWNPLLRVRDQNSRMIIPTLRHVASYAQHVQGSDPIAELIKQNANSVESVIFSHSGSQIQISQFTGWINLKLFDIGKFLGNSFLEKLAERGVVFPAVVEFRTEFQLPPLEVGLNQDHHGALILELILAMKKTMPKLEVINFTGSSIVPIEVLNVMKTIALLKDVYFRNCSDILREECRSAQLMLFQIEPSRVVQNFRQKRIWGNISHFRICFNYQN